MRPYVNYVIGALKLKMRFSRVKKRDARSELKRAVAAVYGCTLVAPADVPELSDISGPIAVAASDRSFLQLAPLSCFFPYAITSSFQRMT